ncbi:bile acid:sodium symporter family protein [Coraliomargarita parva]|uniref:bile acid:sodium symporter family protein n=1 Tax=Coraliomargarita parva TaxID=3014050 RepID=UPI0022B5DB0B|nr:bile acid:sodium symporter family protein [Coraliomargarita parva]
MQNFIKKNSFILILLGAVLLAILLPGPAAKGGLLHSEVTTKLGVWIIFFLQGLSLPTSELTSGYRPKRLHVFVLSWNYLWFPVVTGLYLIPVSLFLAPELRTGLWLLSILPTTVASAITFATVSGGNTSNAIFSTVFSNLLSVLVVPTVSVAYLAAEADANVPLTPLFSKLAMLIIVPLIVGQIIRKIVPGKATLIAKKSKKVSTGIIVFIVHAAFANSVQSGFLDELSGASVVAVIASTVGLLLLASWLVWLSSAWIRPNHAQRVTAFFCASQKSLATGLPLATSILAAAPGVVDPALVLIPLMCYHPSQLVLAGLLSGKFKAQSEVH